MILTNEFLPDVRVYKEAKYLISKGFEVRILCWQRNVNYSLPTQEVVDGIFVNRFVIESVPGSRLKQIRPFRLFIKNCKSFLKKHHCDYLHCNDIDGAIVGYLARRKRTPMVFDMHEYYEKGNGVVRFFWRSLIIFLLKKSIAGIYENTAYLDRKYKKVKNKLFMLKNYPDSSLVKRMDKIKSDVFRIGYHGAVRSQVMFFSALFEAVKDMDDVRVDINGEGPDNPELMALAEKYNNVFIHGPFDGTKVLSQLYANTDVLFCGYNKNSLNYQGDAEVVKFYEAIFTGTPMIMTDGIGMSKKVIDNGYGVVCDVTNPNDIKEAIVKLKNTEYWNECSEKEIANSNQYNWDSAVKILDSIYE